MDVEINLADSPKIHERIVGGVKTIHCMQGSIRPDNILFIKNVPMGKQGTFVPVIEFNRYIF